MTPLSLRYDSSKSAGTLKQIHDKRFIPNDPIPEFEGALDGVPRLKAAPNGKEHQQSVFETDPYGIAAEQFRLMRRRLCNLTTNGGTVLFTSPGPGDGKSLNAHNMAWALAEAGHSTLLLELDLRRPSQHNFLPGRPPYGLVDVLSGEAAPLDATTRLAQVPLFFLGLDEPAPKSLKLLRTQAVVDVMRWARETFAWVVVDGPPVLAASDVEEILPRVDLVLMVVRERVTPRGMLERAANHLGDRLNFLVYNDVTVSDSYGYRY
jgi:Mrp family chromosome partitioning ATPase